jgi:hypothetical protein
VEALLTRQLDQALNPAKPETVDPWEQAIRMLDLTEKMRERFTPAVAQPAAPALDPMQQLLQTLEVGDKLRERFAPAKSPAPPPAETSGLLGGVKVSEIAELFKAGQGDLVGWELFVAVAAVDVAVFFVADDAVGELLDPSGAAVIYNIKGGVGVWRPSTAYTANSNGYTFPTVLNGYVYRVSVAGITGTTEPTWPTTIGRMVTDGGVSWTCAYLQPHYTIKNEVFSAPKGYADGAQVNNGATLTLDGPSREMLSISNLSADYPWQIYLRIGNGRASVSGSYTETVPANTPYGDADRYFDTLPASYTGSSYTPYMATYFPLGARIWKVTPTGANLGQIVTTAGWNAGLWVAAKGYPYNSYVQAPTDNGHFYRNLATCTAGSSAPTFPTSSGATVTEPGGTHCTWKESGRDAHFARLSSKSPTTDH